MKKKFLIVTTIPMSLNFFKGQIRYLSQYFDVELVSGPGEDLETICKAEGVNAHGVKMQREISPIKDIQSLCKLILLFKKVRPHIVHGNTPKAGLLSMTSAWICGVPKRIYFIHGLRYEGAEGFKRILLLNMERLTCYFANEVFTVSYGVKEKLKSDNITDKKIQINGYGSINGINSNTFLPDTVQKQKYHQEQQLPDNTIIFGFVGRIVRDKGINELVEAFLLIAEKHPNTKLLLVGDYEEDLDPIDIITKKAIQSNNNIIITGWQKDIRPYLNLMDVFVLPSYREGFGISIMEAAAMNIPTICSNISGCNEIIKDGFNGKLISPKSVDELYGAMEIFIENPNLILQMGKVSRDYILNKYDQNFVWKESLKNYRELVSDQTV
jgi:glycosyltransferase involved in cell wall biosynthesis